MTATCRAGHPSETLDYCGQCGIAMPGAPPAPAGAAAQPATGPDGPATKPAGPLSGHGGDRTTRSCPNCAAIVADSGTCAECGFRFDAPDSVAVWEEQHWDVVARHDRQYFDMVDPDGIEFPAEMVSRRIPLLGDHVRIGRRSRTKDIFPEIDLSGSLEDVGVSHRHAVLLRQPAGSWALTDQGSTNGTFLNAEQDPLPANERMPLRDGDQIHVGAWTTLTVERVDASDSHSAEVDLPSKDTRGMARARRELDLALLGPQQVTVSGTPVAFGAPKARAVLAILALRIGTAVSTGDLEWALWGDGEPKTAGKALQGYIVALRKCLPTDAIETTPQGYRLVGPKDVVDVFRFERRTNRGRELLASGHPGAAVAEITRALELWRGEPLPDLVDATEYAGEISRLRERRANAEEDLFEGRLHLGDHQGVIADLSAAVEEEPLRERRWGQLMLALHRTGRQVDALRTFQRLRSNLGEEYGTEPSAELVALEHAIVLDKAELRWTPPSVTGDTASGPR